MSEHLTDSQFSDNRADRIAHAVPCYVTVQDRNLKILWVNDLVLQDFGNSSGRTCYEYYNIGNEPCSECPVLRTFSDGLIHSKELQVTNRNGSRATILVSSAPLLDEKTGKISSVIETGVNITSVKDIQKQLILLGQTVAGMAHSIKNIMMGLEGGIYVVNKGIEDRKPDEVKEGWEIVLLNFEKISHIVKDILYCSKEREPNLETIEPNKIIREVYELFKDAAERYAIKINLHLDEELGEATIDPQGLHTVLSNLVSNAMDACKLDLWKDEHLVEIRTRKGRRGATIIEVADNGIGIDRNLKTHVFEDFFTSKGDKGTGLGLMVTQKILREHGGTITFRSRPGHGTTFIAHFPKKGHHPE